MKSFLVLPTLAGLAYATSCDDNDCLRAVIASADTTRHGVQDCSSYLAVTVTPETSTVTSTTTVLPTIFTTVVDTVLFTESEPTTVTTETQSFTTLETTTAATETQTFLETVTITTSAGQTQSLAKRGKARRDRVCTTTTLPSPLPFPTYATACSSLENYVSACSCVGVFPTTITVEPPLTTTVVTETSTVTSSVLSTLSLTETDFVPVTAHESTTTTELVSATDTTSTTVTQTSTSTLAAVIPTGTPICNSSAGAFYAHGTYTTQDLYFYADMFSGSTGGMSWNPASGSTSSSIQYIWAIDDDGHLNLAYNVPPYTYKYYAYTSTSSSGSHWAQLGTQASVQSQVNAGAAVTYINACVHSLTGELTLDAAGRTNILDCGAQLWMSSTLGEDLGRPGCQQMFPTVVKAA